jgi:uracil-DNA glycosylase family 4
MTEKAKKNGEGAAGLKKIAAEIATCTRCSLHLGRKMAVPGEGPADARIMMVGEAPGRHEDEKGKPFVGRSGKVLDGLLRSAGLKRERLFITSIVKCRPPNNRVPRRNEYEVCIQAHLRRQVALIEPDLICILGGVAASALLNLRSVDSYRGKILELNGRRYYVTYHPAAAGRSTTWRAKMSEDLAAIERRLSEGDIERVDPSSGPPFSV